MADLFDRVLAPSHDIAVHVFEAALVDFMAGRTNRAQLIAGFSLDSEATTQLDNLLDKITALASKEAKVGFIAEFQAVMLLCEGGFKYTTKGTFNTRLNQALANWS